MTDNNDNNKDAEVVDLSKLRMASSQENPTKFPNPQVTPPEPRIYHVVMADGNVEEFEGWVGLSSNFLAIGDQEGRILFGAAGGHWISVTDVTDEAQGEEEV